MSRPLHVGLLVPGWPPGTHSNGIVTYASHMRDGLEAAGHRVTLLSIAPLDGHSVTQTDAVEPVSASAWRRPGRALATLLRSGRPSVHDEVGRSIADTIRRVHARDPLDVFEMEESFGWAARVVAESHIPVVVRLHGPAFRTLLGAENTSLEVRERIQREGVAMSRAAAITAPSRSTLQDTLAHYGLTPPLAEAVVNPISDPPDLRTWVLDHCQRSRVLFVGRFDAVKGGDIMLEAFAIAAAACSSLELVFVGPDMGITDAQGSRESFAAACTRLLGPEAYARVKFLGRQSPEEVAALRTSALVTVVASRWENQSYTALEAMRTGCPLVSTSGGGHADLLADGLEGLLVPPDDPAALADAILRLARDPHFAASLGGRARARALREHLPSLVARRAVEVYRQCHAGRA